MRQGYAQLGERALPNTQRSSDRSAEPGVLGARPAATSGAAADSCRLATSSTGRGGRSVPAKPGAGWGGRVRERAAT